MKQKTVGWKGRKPGDRLKTGERKGTGIGIKEELNRCGTSEMLQNRTKIEQKWNRNGDMNIW